MEDYHDRDNVAKITEGVNKSKHSWCTKKWHPKIG